jgi:tetratricopeptide (TPR) repeat protein
MPFKINHAAIAARRIKAQEIFRAAQLSQTAGRLKEAEASIRIAISFDPARSEFKEALGSIRIQAAGARATKLLAGPSERMSDGDLREALTLLEDVLIYRPHDPQLNDRAARVCMKLGKLDLALEYAQTLLERSPDVAEYNTLLGRIQRERGDKESAVRAFEAALKIDEEDLEARRALASMRIGARDAVRGGKA